MERKNKKCLGTQLKIEINLYFQNKIKIMEPARYRCLVKTVFCSPASADFPTATLHTLPSVSAHLIVGCDNMSNKEGWRSFRKRSMMIAHITREEKGRMLIHLHLWCWPSNHSSRNLIVRHYKYQRFVKLNWDVIVESKRAIFFLFHRITSAPDMEETVAKSEIK